MTAAVFSEARVSHWALPDVSLAPASLLPPWTMVTLDLATSVPEEPVTARTPITVCIVATIAGSLTLIIVYGCRKVSQTTDKYEQFYDSNFHVGLQTQCN